MDIKALTCFIFVYNLFILIEAQYSGSPGNDPAAVLNTDDGEKKCTTQLRTCKLKIEDLDVAKKFGVSGQKGEQGYPGFPGHHGAKGDRGLSGFDGIPGQKGQKGEPCSAEVPDYKALKGEPGTKGEPGPIGPPGVSGIDGRNRYTGAKGVRVFPDFPGVPGSPGEKGENGMKGETGENGKDGLPGPIGMPGPPGQRGEIGLNGEAGAPGIPGEKGNPGEKGSKGDMGGVGPAGVPGNPGERGFPGLPGLMGPPGSPGPSGPPGVAGMPGVCPCIPPDVPIINAETRDGEFGTIDNPGTTTCKSAIITTGKYMLEPKDPFEVHCDMSSNLTCLIPSKLTKIDIESKAIAYRDKKKSFWMSEVQLIDIKDIYELNRDQMLWLQEKSVSVTQTLRFHCLNSVPLYKNNVTNHVKLLSWNDVVVGPYPSETTPLYYSIPPETNGCGDTIGNSEWNHADIILTSNKAQRLPIVDIFINDVREENQSFYIEHVKLCFG